MFKKFRLTFLAFTIGLLLSFAGIAMATTQASSSVYNFPNPYAGYYYKNQATVYSTSGFGAYGSASTKTQSGTAPTGYMGISTYLYNDDGYCVTYTPFVYNSSASSGISYGTDPYTASDNYRCRGQSAVYNGSDYVYVYTYYTPYVAY